MTTFQTGTGDLNSSVAGTIPVVTVGNNPSFSYPVTTLGIFYNRSNNGSAMSDTLFNPSLLTTPNGWYIIVHNSDVSASLTLSVTGATINDGSSVLIIPEQTVTIRCDGVNFFAELSSTSSGAGDVVGPGSATDNAAARFNGTTGKLIQNSLTIIDDSGNVSTPGTIFSKVAFIAEDPGSGTNNVTIQSSTPLGASYSLTLPPNTGTSGQVLTTDGTGITTWTSNGAGDVTGPAGATDNAITRFDGTTGKLIQNSTATLDDSGNIVATGSVTTKTALITEDPGAGTNTITLQSPTPLGSSYTLTLPPNTGSSNQVLATDGTGITTWITNGFGDVVGPASATDNALTRFDSTTGKLIQNSSALLDDSGNLSAIGTISSKVSFIAEDPGAGTNATTIQSATPLGASYTLVLPPNTGMNGQVLTTDGSGNTTWVTNSSGDVFGPVSSVDNSVTRFDGTTGKLIQTSNVTIDDSGNMIALGTITTKTSLLLEDPGAGVNTVTHQAPSPLAASYTLTWPVDDGTANQFLQTNGTGTLTWATGNPGNVVGTPPSTDNAIARYDGTTGLLIQNSLVTVDDTGIINTPANEIDFSGSAALKTLGTDITLVGIGAGNIGITGDHNVFIGSGSGGSTTTGANNIFVGYLAGMFNDNGSDNISIGFGAGNGNGSGNQNVCIGSNAGSTDEQTNCTFIGFNSGVLNQANDNTFVGASAGDANTTGTRNVFLGKDSGGANVTGTDCTYIGYQCGLLSTASNNTFVGSACGDANTSGASNTFIGKDAGGANVTNSSCTFVGYQAGLLSTADNNTFLGASAGDANTTGTSNTFVGKDAGGANVTNNACTFVGYTAGIVSTANNNTFVGAVCGDVNTTGAANTFVGHQAGHGCITGGSNVYVGKNAGQLSTASSNTYVGAFTGAAAGAGNLNTLIGFNSGTAITSGGSNAFLGANTGIATTNGGFNTFVGVDAGRTNSSGTSGTFIGNGAGNTNLSANDNTFVGAAAGFTNSTGTRCTYIGTSSGQVATASDNTFLGYRAGFSNTSGNQNTLLGVSAGTTLTTGANNTIVGYNANVGTNSHAGCIVLGSGAVTNAANQLVIASSGVPLTTATSATAGSNGAVPAQVSLYLPVYLNGVAYKIPLFNT